MFFYYRDIKYQIKFIRFFFFFFLKKKRKEILPQVKELLPIDLVGSLHQAYEPIARRID